MEYWQTLLAILWRDVCDFAGDLTLFVILTTLLSYGVARGVRAVIDAPRELAGRAAWRAWGTGIAIFIFARFVVAFLHREGWWHRIWFQGSLLLFASVCSGASVLVFFIRARRSPEILERVRWRFSLRTVLIAQVVWALGFGVWIAARRDKIEFHVKLRQQQAERARQMQHRARCESLFSPYGWAVYMNPKINSEGAEMGPPQLHLLQRHFNQPLQGFHDRVLKEITPDERIVILHLTSDALTDEGLETIGTMATLEDLELTSSQITDAGLAHLRNLRNLKELRIVADQMTDAGVAYFRDLPHLENLTVASVELTEESFAHVAAIKSLRYGSIHDSQITKEQQTAFLRDRQDASAKIYATPSRPVVPNRKGATAVMP